MQGQVGSGALDSCYTPIIAIATINHGFFPFRGGIMDSGPGEL